MSLGAFWRLLLSFPLEGCGGRVGNRAKSVLTSIRSLFIPALIRSVAVTAEQRGTSRGKQELSSKNILTPAVTIANSLLQITFAIWVSSSCHRRPYQRSILNIISFRSLRQGKIYPKKEVQYRLFNCKETLKFKVLFLYEKFADGSC